MTTTLPADPQHERRDAHRRTRKRASVRRAQGIPGHVDGPTIATHIQQLLDSGWTRLELAATSGVSDRAIRYILAGQREVQLDKARALLAVHPKPQAPRVEATGTRRRIEALAAIGWPIHDTARQAGCSHNYAFEILNGTLTTVLRAVADGYAAVYRTHAWRPGPSPYARGIARRNGWAGPLAWDGNIDDPAAEPDLENPDDPEFKRDELAAQRRDEIWVLWTACIGAKEIADRVGMGVKTVEAILREFRTGKKPDRRKKPQQEAAA